MKLFIKLLGIASLVLILNSCTNQNTGSQLNPKDFKNPPPGSKVHTWWHWLDGAITKDGITKDLESMKKQGVCQATILNVGLFNGKDFGVKRVVFDSPEWHELFIWALKEANRLGITLGAHNCDGWSTSGGPWITPEMSMKQFVWTKTYVSGGKTSGIVLPQPYANRDFYKDVAVLAFKTKKTANSFQLAKPVCRVNSSPETKYLTDGDPSSAEKLNKGDKILMSFDNKFKTGKVVIYPGKKFMWSDGRGFICNYILSASNDGIRFKKLKELETIGLNKSFSLEIPLTEAKYFQLEIKDLSDIDTFIDFTISEIEFLQASEQPTFNPAVNHLLEKTVSLKASERSCFDTQELSVAADPIDESTIVNLTAMMDKSGLLEWSAPEGNWCVLRFGYTTTGAMNGPATAEGTGLECDKMDSAALDLHFSNFPKRLIDDAGQYAGNTFKFLLIDSWECGYQNWTAAFPSEFEKNRGYSMMNWIPVLCGETIGNPALSDAFLYDFRKTIADLVETNYYKHFRDLCHKENIEMHAEIIYGDANYPPLEILRTNSYVDLPMFEFWTSTDQNTFTDYSPSSRPFESFPVFAALGYNIPVVGSEAYTGMAHYSESPNDLKSFGDRAFCSGINQIILHSYVHQPFDNKPGMTLGQFASHFNRNNLYWQYSSEWMKYQERIQYVLQKGVIASNVLYYIGDQLPQYIDNVVVNELPFGYRGMACNYDILKNKASVKNGKIILDNGMEYAILVLPVSNTMEMSTLQRIAELVEQGAIIIGQKPLRQFSLKGQMNDESAFNELAGKVWGSIDGVNIKAYNYGAGWVYSGMPVAEVLRKNEIGPEFKTNVSDSMNLMYIHKKYMDKDVYFVANQRNIPLNRECVFAVGNKVPQIWDPLTGSILNPLVFSVTNGLIRIPVSFKPRESKLFIFENEKPLNFLSEVFEGDKRIFPLADATDTSVTVPFVNAVNKEYEYSTLKNGTYSFVDSKNEKVTMELKTDEIYNITGIEGTIEFLPEYKDPISPVSFTSLKSYTEFDNPQIRYFSGIAKYTINFSTSDEILSSKEGILLDLGKFESIAQLVLNKDTLGIDWMVGSRFNVKGILQKSNTLEVTIANTYRNRIIGDYIECGELKNVWTSAPVHQFLKRDKPLKPSGLMGPLTLVVEKKTN
jgi:hypothetical protein